MKLLLIAYACEPNRGSEPGIGWQWAYHLANNPEKDVYVITRRNNKPVVDKFAQESPLPHNLHVFYYDLPTPLLWAKKHGMSVNMYYAMWLYGASSYAKKLHEVYHFDMAHHITFGVFRDASFLYRLRIPYVAGPFGGGDYTPDNLLGIYSKSDIRKEKIRKLYNVVSLWNPFLRKTLNNAGLILAKTNNTKNILKSWNEKVVVKLEIGIEEVDASATGKGLSQSLTSGEISPLERNKQQFLYVGRFLHWKGIALALEAFRRYEKNHPNAEFLLIGKGELQQAIEDFRKEYHLENKIRIIAWMKQNELRTYYRTACAMLFPSLHDSSGNVVLEAISNGLPAICLDNAGPTEVLGNGLKDFAVETNGMTQEDVVDGIVERMEKLSEDDSYFNDIQERGFARAQQLLWQNTIDDTYNLIQERLF